MGKPALLHIQGSIKTIYRIKTTIEGVFTSMDLALQAKEIMLSYDGDKTYTSTDFFELDKLLTLQWIGRGLSFQEWTITLSISKKKPDGSFEKAKKWEESGAIPQGGGSQVYREINLTTDLS